jgi:MFS family permease
MDREAFRHVIASRAMVVGNLGVAGCVFLTTGLLAWLPSLLQRNFGVSAAQAGTFLGASYAITGLAGSVTGGLLSDALAVRFGAKSRLLVAMIAYIFGASLTVALVLCKQVVTAYALCVPLQFAGAMYLGPCAANVNSLVPQRLRATASAFYIATLVFLGSALGPYVIGKLSDQFAHQGVATGHALQLAVKWSLLSGIPTIALLTLGIAWISPVDEFDVAD